VVKKWSRWTEQEDNVLTTCYEDHTAKELSKLLGRTEAGVIVRLRRLGVHKIGKYTDWTGEDDETLKTLMGEGYNYREIGELMGKRMKAVSYRAGKLGLTKPRGIVGPDYILMKAGLAGGK